ncbi:hypothetical protein, conserved [Leishmania tarentolae]|uniref:Uncharacterized protein n=1 Tax=Leishmania tarentolae TaxID=5689 RepID=A0A640KT46_LEITA|nr:hypothetical protein, conserved [Leishmania tarentolae]
MPPFCFLGSTLLFLSQPHDSFTPFYPLLPLLLSFPSSAHPPCGTEHSRKHIHINQATSALIVVLRGIALLAETLSFIMFRVCSVWCSNALHNSTPFVDGALQLMKLHLAHRNAMSEKNKVACHAIEQEFFREVEVFRPCFTMSASLEVAQQYSRRLYAALKYFRMDDDPLIRQLDLLLGRRAMQDGRHGSQGGFFKGARKANTPAFGKGGETTHEALAEHAETTLPTELPNPPKVDLTAPRRPGALRIHHRYRGHWVLQEPDIAITRSERREDPW